MSITDVSSTPRFYYFAPIVAAYGIRAAYLARDVLTESREDRFVIFGKSLVEMLASIHGLAPLSTVSIMEKIELINSGKMAAGYSRHSSETEIIVSKS